MYSDLEKKIKKKFLKVSVIGIGYVGLPLVLNIAKKYKVVAFDINKKRIQSLNFNNDLNGEFSRHNINKVKKNINFTFLEKHLKNSDIFILSIPTPVKKNKKPDLSLILSAAKTIKKYINSGNLIIVESTVFPGFTRNILKKFIDKKNEKKIMFGYSPERVNPGDQKNTLNNITKVISGEDDKVSKIILKFYKSFLNKNKIFQAKSLEIAEFAKLLENSQRDINIAFINEITQLSYKLKLNIFDVLSTAKTKWNFLNFTPGLVGGHCIGVDPYYLYDVGLKSNFKSKLVLSGRKTNDHMYLFLKKIINNNLKNKIKNSKYKILICGAAFKENVSDFRNSQSILLYNSFKKKHQVDMYDPNVLSSELLKKNGIQLIKNLKKEYYDSIIFTLGHNEFKTRGLNYFLKACKKTNVLIDLKNIFQRGLVI